MIKIQNLKLNLKNTQLNHVRKERDINQAFYLLFSCIEIKKNAANLYKCVHIYLKYEIIHHEEKSHYFTIHKVYNNNNK